MIFILQKYTIAQGKEAKKGYCQNHYSTLVEKVVCIIVDYKNSITNNALKLLKLFILPQDTS